MALPRESHPREIRSNNISVYEKRSDRNIGELHAPSHKLLPGSHGSAFCLTGIMHLIPELRKLLVLRYTKLLKSTNTIVHLRKNVTSSRTLSFAQA